MNKKRGAFRPPQVGLFSLLFDLDGFDGGEFALLVVGGDSQHLEVQLLARLALLVNEGVLGGRADLLPAGLAVLGHVDEVFLA